MPTQRYPGPDAQGGMAGLAISDIRRCSRKFGDEPARPDCFDSQDLPHPGVVNLSFPDEDGLQISEAPVAGCIAQRVSVHDKLSCNISYCAL